MAGTDQLRPTPRRLGLGWALGAAVAAHAAGWLLAGSGTASGSASFEGRSPVMALRLAAVMPMQASDPAPASPAVAAAPSTSAAPTEVPATAAEPPAARARSEPVPTTTEGGSDTVTSVDGRDVVDGYVLRRALSTPPSPRVDPPLAWPAGWIPRGTHTGVYTVFIDETGRVRRMVIDGPTLAPVLDEAARTAFEATRFEPGRVGDRVVKSLIRIEVTFDDTTPVAGATVVSRRAL